MHTEDILNIIRQKAEQYKSTAVQYGTAPRGYYTGEDVMREFSKAVALEDIAEHIENILGGDDEPQF